MNTHKDDVPVFVILHRLIHMSKYQAFKRLDDFDLKPSQAGILFVLSCNGKLSQRELAERIGITPPSMTVALRKMETRGYIEKEPDEKDQRIIRILLTEKGESCVEDIRTVMDEMEAVLYQNMTQEEKMLLRRLLLQMQENLLDSKEFRGLDMALIMERTRPALKDRI
ncbi:MarR family winged helix-turn-helix transcriptional regulator [Extibacter muris]|uniref:MarR family winged helix-turn-helix transcriptional regulator n=1 Tax=Extibacter muris TaxID=1796622 RepID=UPI001D0720E7|nr:MarR family transcriptional regulator [Extibacter muris]MCB6201793.1 MarR family transcriptional regulator [Extibacter muris]MCQ4663584.1 MarR family transcriptional regulator [Extibacter muris]MCQ4695043.1 MarR family transcriptional regulator [Extibacter muris]